MGSIGDAINSVFKLKFDFKSLFEMIKNFDIIGIFMMIINKVV